MRIDQSFPRSRLPAPSRRRPIIEEIEPRILYSADFSPAVLDHGASVAQAEHRMLDAHGEFAHASEQDAQPRRHELVLVDTDTPDYQKLVADIHRQAGEGRDIEVVLLDSSRDGIQQVSDALASRQQLSALHLISHGTDGRIQLGSSALDFDALLKNATRIKAWGQALTADADMLLYGCNVAHDADGKALVHALARLTGADVAASEDTTGSAALGGDWDLEYQTGRIDTSSAVDALIESSWHATLGHTETAVSWAPTTQNAWEVKDLNAAFGVPANAVVQVAIFNSDSASAQAGGVRAVGSSIDRSFLIDQRQQGPESIEMLVQADANGRIETYAGSTARIDFTMLGYWTNGSYVETAGAFASGANAVWNTQSLSSFGVGAGDVAEILISNSTNNSPQVGVRTEGSTLNRVIDIRNSGSGGVQTMTMLVAAGSTAAANIEHYTQLANVIFNVVGYWSTPPGNYIEAFTDVGAPSANATWQAEDLSAVGVPANAVADLVLTNEQATASNAAGVREAGSTNARLLALDSSGAGVNGGPDNARMLVKTDAGGRIEWYHDNIGNADFYLLGYFCDNRAPSLDAGRSPVLLSQSQGSGLPSGPVGTLVSQLVDFATPAGQVDNVTDPDPTARLGIAVTAADSANGTWYYSTDAGSSWNALGTVTGASARLLAADANTRIYFQPNASYSGSLSNAITFRAWDRTSGINGGTADTSVSGGATSFSSATDTASIAVTAVNVAPVTSAPSAQASAQDTPPVFSRAGVDARNAIQMHADVSLMPATSTATSAIPTSGDSAGLAAQAGIQDLRSMIRLDLLPALNAYSPRISAYLATDTGGRRKVEQPSLVSVAVFQEAEWSLVMPGVASPAQSVPSLRSAVPSSAPISERHDEEIARAVEELLRWTGLVLSVGAVYWANRAAGLVTSLLAASPAWSAVDPLRALDVAEGQTGHDRQPMRSSKERLVFETSADGA